MKRNLILLFCISIIALYALSCATVPPRVTPASSLTENETIITVNASFDKVYDAFIRYFSDKGFTLDNGDKFSGHITTNDIEITDETLNIHYRDVTGAKGNYDYLKAILKFEYCDCGQPNTKSIISKNLYYKYIVDIKKVNDKSTQFRVITKFWTELYEYHGFYVFTYEGDWECASSGEYEKKVIDDIKTNYLKK